MAFQVDEVVRERRRARRPYRSAGSAERSSSVRDETTPLVTVIHHLAEQNGPHPAADDSATNRPTGRQLVFL
jgi:hypothetical protein